MVPLTIAHLKMMARNRHTSFWALLFPLLLVTVFGLVDIDRPASVTMVAIDEAGTPSSQQLRENLAGIQLLNLQEEPKDAAAARRKLEKGELDYLVLIPRGFGGPEARDSLTPLTNVTLLYGIGSEERNQLVEAVVRNLVAETASTGAANPAAYPVVSQGIEVRQVSYFDLLLMGLVCLGIMTHSIVSIAVKISTYRNQAILKRMLATPLAIWKYFASEITAHLVLSLVQASIIMAVGVFLLGAHIQGNPAWIFLIVMLGSLVFLNIGFIVSAWANSPAAASGMGNAVVLPMLFLGGTFFSTASLPWVLPHLVQALPLTPMLTALRQVAIHGAPLWETWPQLAALGGWVLATGLVAVRVFRFS